MGDTGDLGHNGARGWGDRAREGERQRAARVKIGKWEGRVSGSCGGLEAGGRGCLEESTPNLSCVDGEWGKGAPRRAGDGRGMG